jgi:hypothetical protein
MFTDPTGHAACDEDGNCYQRGTDRKPSQSKKLENVTVWTGPNHARIVKNKLMKFSNVGFIDIFGFSWQEQQKILVVIEALARAHGGQGNFEKALGNFSIYRFNLSGLYGIVPPYFEKNIIILTYALFVSSDVQLGIAHEIAHVFDFGGGGIYKSESFISAFSPDTCATTGSTMLGCIASKSTIPDYSEVIISYRQASGDSESSYLPTGKLSRSYSHVYSIEDFADTYTVVALGANGSFGDVDPERKSIMNSLINP